MLQKRLTDLDVTTPVDISEGLTTQQTIDLQLLLRGNQSKEYYAGAIDGVIGRMSKNAYAQFKADVGLPADILLDLAARAMLVIGFLPAEAPGAEQPMPADIPGAATIQAAIDAGVLKLEQGASWGDEMIGPFAYSVTDGEGNVHAHRVSILVRVKEA